MARIVGGSPFGEIRGKIGGFVASRNRSGQYLRQYVVPVDPSSQAQMRARDTFAVNAGGWHGLTDVQKSQWNAWAISGFNPKNQANVGQMSGMNAFIALNNGITQINGFSSTAMGGLIGVTSLGTETPLTCPAIAVPPTETFVANIDGGAYSAGSPVVTMSLNPTATLTTDGEFTFQLILSEAVTNFDEFINTKGQNYGFAVYRSEPLVQARQFVTNPFMQLMKIIPPLTFGTPGTGSTITISNTDPINTASYVNLPTVGNVVQMSVFAISRDGQLARVGTTMVTVS